MWKSSMNESVRRNKRFSIKRYNVSRFLSFYIKNTSQLLQLLVSKSIYYLFPLFFYQLCNSTSSKAWLIASAPTLNSTQLVSWSLGVSTYLLLFWPALIVYSFCNYFVSLYWLLAWCRTFLYWINLLPVIILCTYLIGILIIKCIDLMFIALIWTYCWIYYNYFAHLYWLLNWCNITCVISLLFALT